MSIDEYVLFFVVRLDGIRGSVKGTSKQIGLHFDAVDIIQEKNNIDPKKLEWSNGQLIKISQVQLLSSHLSMLVPSSKNIQTTDS